MIMSHFDPPYPTVLGFDFGMKRIGIAIGQTLTKTARPVAIIKATHGIPDWTVIQHLITTWDAASLVVGMPYHMDGSQQTITRSAIKFAHRLRARFNQPVYTVDERLTTVEARRQYFADSTRSKSHRRSVPSWDSLAAKLILEQWLQQEAHDDTVRS